LEEAFGSVTSINQLEALNVLRETASEEQVEKVVQT
jgi:hypothetical protein